MVPKSRVFRSQTIGLMLLLNQSSELQVTMGANCKLEVKTPYGGETMRWAFKNDTDRDEAFDALMWELRKFYEDFESDE